MHYACQFNNFEAVKWLWTMGVPFDQVDKIGLTPLMFACQTGNFDLVDFLISNGANPETIFNNNALKRKGIVNYTRKMIHFAAESGNPEVIKLFLNQNVDSLSWDGTPLIIAAKNGHTDACKLLLETNANPNLPSEFGEYPIHYAAEKGNFDLLKLLVEHGANINKTNSNNKSPLALAFGHNSTDCILYLLEKNANITGLVDMPFIAAIKANNKTLITKFAEDPTRLKDTDFEGIYSFIFFYNTAYHILAQLDNVEIMECISKIQEPDDTLNQKGYSALQWAASSNKPNAVQFLVQHGCNPNLRNRNDLLFFFSNEF